MDNNKVAVEEARKALQEALENEDKPAIYFWTGFLIALS